MSDNRTPVVGVMYAPGGAATLPDLCGAAAGVCEVALMLHKETTDKFPQLAEVARELFGTPVIVDDAGWPENCPGLDGLVTFNDELVDEADAATAALGLPGSADGPSPWDKLRQRRLLEMAGVTRVRAHPVNSPADLRAAAHALGLPGVLKPRRGVGGLGVTIIDSGARLRAVETMRSRWKGLLYEQFIPAGRHPSGTTWLADHVSVETVSVGSARHHVAVVDKLPLSVTAGGGSEGADAISVTGSIIPSRLPERWQKTVTEHVDRALDVLGVSWRVTHTEVRVTEETIDIIEVNGRAAGHLHRMLMLLNGPDLLRVALLLAQGREPDGLDAPMRGFAAALYPVFPDRSGLVRSRVRRADIQRLPGVAGVDELAVSGSPRAANGARLAVLRIAAPTVAKLDELIAGVCGELSGLFAPDGLVSDPWMIQFATGNHAAAGDAG